MIRIRHRVNAIDDLAALAPGIGAEIDLRSRGDRIVLNHDPFLDGDDLEAWLDRWADGTPRGTLVLNPKEDGLEDRVRAALGARGVDDWFFLDLPVPTMVRLACREGEPRVAVRASEWEPIEAARAFAGRAAWAWLDSFTGAPPPVDVARALAADFRVCLVSPELQRQPADRIDAFLHLAPHLAAVCTKHPERWR
ncbi:MAG TPA: hypothetical protein PK313_06850 [Myxococcota bacterium]|nr:hypothetical protein [Myxococcota bacterium]